MKNNLETVLNPSSVAIIGASKKEGSIGYEIMKNLVRERFTGQLYPVSLKETEMFGLKCHKSVLDIEGAVDLAVIVVPAKFVAETIEECGKKKIKGAVIISAGFKEIGAEGAALEKQAYDTAKKYGVTVIGPNCLGILNTNPKISLNAAFAPVSPIPGVIGFASQSGALCSGILNVISSLNIGIKHLVSLGNQTDVSANDFIEYWKDSDDIQQVLLYLESMQRPAEFLKRAKSLTKKKPLLVVKSGKSDEGAKAASSHTGSLASSDTVCQALFDSAGAIREDGLRAIFNTASVFEKCPIPKGKNVGIVTNTGGLGVLATDILVNEGMKLGAIGEATKNELRSILPPQASVKNPVDTIASATTEQYAQATELMLKDKNVDMLLVLYIYLFDKKDIPILKKLNELKLKYPTKPIIGVFMTTEDFKDRVNNEIEKNDVPYFSYVDEAVWGLKRLCERSAYLNNLKIKPPLITIDGNAAKKIIDNAKARFAKSPKCNNTLTTLESLKIFECYGLPLPKYALVKTENDLDTHLKKIGFPCVLKISSFSLSHKTDIGGVALNIQSIEQLHAEYRAMLERIKGIGEQDNLEGIVLMQQVKGAREFVAGVSSNEDVHILMFGLGGIFIEAINEVRFVALPLDANGCERLLSGKRIPKLLDNVRGNAAIDKAKLSEIFYEIDRFISDFAEVSELDLNPIIADKLGNLFVVDARIALK
jgi:acetyltransferase